MKYNAEAVLRAYGLERLADFKYTVLRHPRHIDYEPSSGDTEQIVCRVCGVKIAGWLDDDITEQQVDRLSDHHTLTKMIVKQKFRRLANCAQAHFVLSNGALYEPVLCRDCVVDMTFIGAQECWVSDLVEMVGEAMAHARQPDRVAELVKGLSQLTVLPTRG